MSLFATVPMSSDWSSFRLGQRPSHEQEDIGLGLGYGRIQTSTVESRPPLRSHKSFPHTLGTSSYTSPRCGSPLSQVAHPGYVGEPNTSSSEDQGATPTPNELTVQTSFGGSAPASPVPQLTPTSGDADNEDQMVDDEDDDDDAAIADEQTSGAEAEDSLPAEKTAAERRAEKRKMKRFRLTHNQTRFLMSEFARQAHPDAAQRERLSREIPGLSPRQVQVWFQNRRAKLKRLTTDDRERMMKSRALPDDFDMSHALHSPFGSNVPHSFQPQTYSTPVPPLTSYVPTYETGMLRPLMINGLRRETEEENHTSPASISSTFGSFYTPPGSVAASENMSPVSPTNERAPWINTSYPQSSPRAPTIFPSRSGGLSSNPSGHQNVPRLQLHDRTNRSRAESLASPLRTSISYGGSMDFAGPQSEENASATPPNSLTPTTRTLSISETSLSQPHGLGFNHNFHSSTVSRVRPTVTTFPPGLDFRPSYRPLLPFSSFNSPNQQNSHVNPPQFAGQITTSHQASAASQGPIPYASAPLASAQDFHLPSSNELYSYGDQQEDSMTTLGGPQSENQLELESYYKSESRRHMGLASRPTNSFSPDSGVSSQGPQTAGVKRRRDSGPSGDGHNDGLGVEFGGGVRRRSFTLPSGFGS